MHDIWDKYSNLDTTSFALVTIAIASLIALGWIGFFFMLARIVRHLRRRQRALSKSSTVPSDVSRR